MEEDEGYLHQRVDDGERGQFQHKATPILIADGMSDSKKISRLFQKNSRDLDASMVDFVYRRFLDYRE